MKTMPMQKISKKGQPFNQNSYIASWQKENMASVSAKYKKEFVQDFKRACSVLGLKQSEVFRKAMEEVIETAKEKKED